MGHTEENMAGSDTQYQLRSNTEINYGGQGTSQSHQYRVPKTWKTMPSPHAAERKNSRQVGDDPA
jgi:hypothetical protein